MNFNNYWLNRSYRREMAEEVKSRLSSILFPSEASLYNEVHLMLQLRGLTINTFRVQAAPVDSYHREWMLIVLEPL